ncbi:hypothetical protein [Phyllobacterium myrsinacearum]|uniref:DUF2345 domain-containing protein n=1 Tax=Phyllobacterium myrsinacearum TaxID=28101 RepID=A0A839EX37_9HYPH|nr:hypothetical protein [Phyllobacterium myrsinacearum]MBA8880957.1 hypothetical protein [Phyllobacterium myrsinacearum]
MNDKPKFDKRNARSHEATNDAWSTLMALAKLISVNETTGTLTIQNGKSRLVLRQDGVITVEGESIRQLAARNIVLDAGVIDLN